MNNGGSSGSGGTGGSGGKSAEGGSSGNGAGGTSSSGGSGTGGIIGSGGRGSGGAVGSGGDSAGGTIVVGGRGSGGVVGSGGSVVAGAPGSGGRGSGGAVGSGGKGTGGAIGTGGTSGAAGGTAISFDWGTTTFNASGGSSVSYQGHYTGQTCVSPTCHRHNITYGGTIYQSNGSSTAGNIQIGIRMGNNLVTSYSGSQGNFYGSISGASWTAAQIAIRNASGTAVMPTNASASGDCNSCHSSSNRIVVP